jgi:hypothetical protein
MEGVRDAFEAIVASGGRIAHATDCKGPLQHYPIAAKRLRFSAAMACGDDVEHGKPDPLLVDFAVKKLGAPAGAPITIGDTSSRLAKRRPGGAPRRSTFSRAASYGTVLLQAGCCAVSEELHDLIVRLTPTAASQPPRRATETLRNSSSRTRSNHCLR